MANVIQFLESLGSNAALAHLSMADYAATVASLDIDGAQRQALLDRDEVALNALIAGRSKVYCLIATPEQ